MTRNHIAFIIPSLESGGAERVVSTLANSLIADYDITIIVVYKSTPFYALDKKIDIKYCFETYKTTTTPITSLFFHFKLCRKIIGIIKRNQIKTIIGFMTTANIHSVLASLFTKAKSIISERAHPEFEATNLFWRKTRRLLYPKTNTLVVQTNAVKTFYNAFMKSEQLEVIRNPISKDLVRKRVISHKKENIILSVGRLDDTKNHALLIKAFNKIDTKDWILQIIGKGPNEEALQVLIKDLNLGDKVSLVGNTKEIYRYYNRASVFVFTSRHEGFPNALIEAMFYELACISTDCPYGPSELINDGENGFLIPVDDQDMLENRLQSVINNDELRRQLQTNASKKLDAFDSNTIYNQWKTLIENT